MWLLSKKQKEAVFSTIELYMVDPYNEELGSHSLREEENRIRSIVVESDLRIILRDNGDGTIVLMNVGTHERVYGKQ